MDKRRQRGFEPASGLLRGQIRAVGESRGFAVARLLTHWPEIAGEAMARVTRPVKVSYGRTEGLGATLTLLVSGANGPQVQMGLEPLRQRVNAAYGYGAISRITLTQTAATGFAEGQAAFAGPTAQPRSEPAPDPALAVRATGLAQGIGDTSLRQALEAMGRNVLTRQEQQKKEP